jgi:hypothetical protein
MADELIELTIAAAADAVTNTAAQRCRVVRILRALFALLFLLLIAGAVALTFIYA